MLWPKRRRANAPTHARLLLDATAAFSEASRHSSAAIVERLAGALRRLDARLDTLLVFHPCGEDLACVFAGGSRSAYLHGIRLRRDDPVSLPAAAARRGCAVALHERAGALAPTDRFALAIPLLDGRTPAGVAYVASVDVLPTGLRETVVSLVERASAPYVLGLERERERDDAARDALTGLLSNGAFRRLLDREAARGANGDRSLCLWYADTDGFKEVNDRFGHRAGDTVLRNVAAVLERHLIAGVDVAARTGGDEFCALLQATGKRRGIERAQAFCDAVRVSGLGLSVRVTVSVGVAAFPHDATTAHALLDAADAAMYRSKRDGRDRVSFCTSPGIYASLPPEAARRLSRTFVRCRSSSGGSS